MITVNIESDVKLAISEIVDMERQLPFVIASTLNSTAFKVREHIVTETYPQSFKVRNSVFPRRLFRVVKLATKRDLVTVLGDSLGREYLQDQAQGGVKTPRGSLAIPTDPESVRTSRGAVRKPLKPVNITNRRDTFLVTKGGKKSAILQRKRGSRKADVIYLFRDQAIIPKRFPCYEATVDQFAFHIQSEFARHLRRLVARRLFA